MRPWPAVAVAAVALAGAAAAYGHAEASRAASLGYAGIEVAAVVLGWLVLAGPLGLRGLLGRRDAGAPRGPAVTSARPCARRAR